MTHRSVIDTLIRRGKKACDVTALPGWEGIEDRWRYLEATFAAECVRRFDGPDARRWIVELRGATLELQYDDVLGTMIVSPGPESDEILSVVAADLERRLDGLTRGASGSEV